MTTLISASHGSAVKSPSSIKIAIRMLRFTHPVWKTAILACAIVILRIVVEIPSIYFLSPLITSVSRGYRSSHSHQFLSWIMGTTSTALELRSLFFWMVLSQITLGGMMFLRSVWDCKLSMDTVFHIRNAIYDKLQNVSFSFQDKFTSGQLINRAISDLQCVRNFINTSLIASLDIVLTIGAYLALLFFRSPWIMLAAILPMIPSWMVISRVNKKMRPIFQSQQEAADSQMVSLTENVAGVHVIRAFGLQNQEINKYSLLNENLLRRLFESIKLQAALTPILKTIATAAHIMLFLLVAWLIKAGQMVVGDLMILGLVMGTILGKMQQINQIVEVYQRAIVSARRLFEVLDTPNAKTPQTGSKPIILRGGEIEFDRVSFGYDPRKPVLRNIGARLVRNKITALVGRTGSGKTTLASLIARFYEPQSGIIRIDGQDIRSINPKALRKVVGYSFQETFLFSDTIRNNIRYGRTDVSEEMMKFAAKAAEAEEFILSLPRGYDTVLGEQGIKLSGGQRQRLSLARALVYDPQILILDDAMAALDSKTEKTIHSKINPFLEGRTVLIIAHRLSTIGMADHILVMKDGSIEQYGTHEDLIESGGHYLEILSTQLAPTRKTSIAVQVHSEIVAS